MANAIKKYLTLLLEPPGNVSDEDIAFFRHRLLVWLLLFLCTFSTLAYIPSVYYGYLYRFDSVIFVDTLTVAAVFFLLIRKRMPFLPRALGMLTILYTLGVWLLVVLGPTGAGFMWLLLFSILTGLLLGLVPALISLGLNLITIAGLSLLVIKQTITWTLLPENEIAIWIVKSVNFICINAIIAGSTGFIIARISRKAEEETQRRIQLDREIQARMRAEKENRALTERLYQAQKMEALGTLAGGIAHDFNNILSAIKGYSQLSLAEPGLPEPVLTGLQKIIQAAERAQGITGQISTFGRQSQAIKSPNDLGEITSECIGLIMVGIPSDICFDVNIQPGPFPVLGDKNQLFQVIMNLLTNGIQAMDHPAGTREKKLTLSLAPMTDDQPLQNHGLCADQPCHVLKVADTGSGIAPEHLNRIFDPYFTTKKIGEGTGLGLSITHSIVQEHHGDIWVDSSPGQGTEFTIILPALNEKQAAERASATG